MAGRLAGKIAYVTGIGAGIGKGCALVMAREGATVVGCDINPTTAMSTVAEARAEGLDIKSVQPIDLTDRSDVARYIDQATTYGRIDVLVNAGAINPKFQPFNQLSYDDIWTPTIRGEVDIVFLTCQAAWPWLLKSGRASIVNFASVAAFEGNRLAGMAAHCAGKGAVLAMTRQIAVEGAQFGIRANTIAPGLIVTPATISAGMTEGDKRKAIENATPMGRLGTPEDIAYCAVYLACDESSWVTGVNIPVDGGVLAA